LVNRLYNIVLDKVKLGVVVIRVVQVVQVVLDILEVQVVRVVRLVLGVLEVHKYQVFLVVLVVVVEERVDNMQLDRLVRMKFHIQLGRLVLGVAVVHNNLVDIWVHKMMGIQDCKILVNVSRSLTYVNQPRLLFRSP